LGKTHCWPRGRRREGAPGKKEITGVRYTRLSFFNYPKKKEKGRKEKAGDPVIPESREGYPIGPKGKASRGMTISFAGARGGEKKKDGKGSPAFVSLSKHMGKKEGERKKFQEIGFDHKRARAGKKHNPGGFVTSLSRHLLSFLF